MSGLPPPTRSRPSRGFWFGLFWISCLILYIWLAFTSPDDGVARAVAEFLTGMMGSSLLPLFNSLLNSRHEDHYIPRYQFFWIVLFMFAAAFAFQLAVDPHEPLGDIAGRAAGWPLGYATGYTILYAGWLQLPPPEVVARHNRQFRWGVAILVGIILISSIVAWYRLQ